MDVEVQVDCEMCGQQVTRVVSPGCEVRYCSRSCSRRAERRHRRTRWVEPLGDLDTILATHTTAARCSSTGKVQYKSDKDAWILIAEKYPDAATLAPYPCDDCNCWHLGNSKKAKTRHRLRVREVRAAKRLLAE